MEYPTMPHAEQSVLHIVLVEDHQMTRIGLRLMLENEPRYRIVAEAENGKDAVSIIDKIQGRCHLILMDIGLPDMDGVEATQRIREKYPDLPVMMLTSKDHSNDVFAALGAGANAYCLKGASLDTLKTAIDTVAEGASWMDPGIARLVLSRFQALNAAKEPAQTPAPTGFIPKPNSSGLPPLDCPLTPREMEVLKHIVEGHSNAEIAEKLVITKATAKAHVHSILQKLCVDDRTQAAVLAMREGIIRLEEINPVF
jgi:DNA-binding NarL/FixJ family response regulator